MLHLIYSLIILTIIIALRGYYKKKIEYLKNRITNLETIRARCRESISTLEQFNIEKSTEINEQERQLALLTNFIINIVSTKIFVYTQSKFYHNYSVYNNRYYAKIERSVKAEAIPLLKADELGNVYDIYGIINDVALSSNNKKQNINIVKIINTNTIKKITLKNNLENRILKTYKRGKLL
jgi:uncharacterized coiled-coil protein SlyX